MNYRNKYLKYKKKYNLLKQNILLNNNTINKQFGGKESIQETDTIKQLDNDKSDRILDFESDEIVDKKVERDIFVNKKDLLKKIGILDPDGIEDNPLTNEPYRNIYYDPDQEITKYNPTYRSISDNSWTTFPMYEIREKSINMIYENQVILIVSGTGSGKTVLTPKYTLHALNYQGKIAITNPKRIPSEENAIYAAKTLDVKLGDQVGLKFRGSDANHYSQNSKLVYCTDGFILAKLKTDPLLNDYDCVIIDEAHERGVNIDLLLLLLKDVVFHRPKFKLIIMSATINDQIFKDYFPKDKFKFGIIDAGSKPNKPVKEYFLEDIKFLNKKSIYNIKDGNVIIKRDYDYLEPAVKIAINILSKTESGDILIFVGGKGQGGDGCLLLQQELAKVNENRDVKLYCDVLHSATSKVSKEYIKSMEEYKSKPGGPYNRKVIFATEVAESSITFDVWLFSLSIIF